MDRVRKEEVEGGESDPSKIFEFEMERRTQCTECDRVKYTSTKERSLAL